MKDSGTAASASLCSRVGAPHCLVARGSNCGKAEWSEVDKSLNRMCRVCVSREVTEINDILHDIFRRSLTPYS